MFFFLSVLGRGVEHAMPWMQAVVVTVTNTMKPVKGEARDSSGFVLAPVISVITYDDNEMLLHNDPSGWAFVLSLKIRFVLCYYLTAYRTGFTPWRLKLL